MSAKERPAHDSVCTLHNSVNRVTVGVDGSLKLLSYIRVNNLLNHIVSALLSAHYLQLQHFRLLSSPLEQLKLILGIKLPNLKEPI